MTKEELIHRLQGRSVYIWGARTYGITVCRKLQQWGIAIQGFVDSIVLKQTILGLDVLRPEEFFKQPDAVVVICTRVYSQTIKDICREGGVKSSNIIDWNALARFDYYIETNNRCNLKCCTCDISSMYNEEFHDMSHEFFKKCIDKIRICDPFVSYICLYCQNEPLLSKELWKKIEYCKEHDLGVGISTNLMVKYDFARLLKSQPDWIRISMSGWGENYEKMHRGGKFDVLLKHLHELSSVRKQFAPETSVEIIFHKYRHNEDDAPKIEALCKELGFEFRIIYASIIGLESVVNYLEGRPIPRKMRQVLPLLCRSVEDTAKMSFAYRHLPCPYKNLLEIHSDGTIAECNCWQGSIYPHGDIMSLSLDDIQKIRDQSHLCEYCVSKGLQYFYHEVFDETKK